MFPPFDTRKAFSLCQELLELLSCRKLILERSGKESLERRDSGVVIGVMICKDADGNEIVLAACSGTSRYLQFSESAEASDKVRFVLVPPVVSAQAIAQALSENDKEIHEITDALRQKTISSEMQAVLYARRKSLTTESLSRVHNLYSFACLPRPVSMRSLKSICEERNNSVLPPTGTGECAEPKLLHYALTHSLVPIGLAQTYYNGCDCRRNGEYVPICNERCGIILPAMLGLEILYKDDDIIVVNKQSGLLSVPGRGPDKQDCIVNRVRALYPECIEQPAVHRLDMETSGLLLLAFNKDAHRALNLQFEKGLVKKSYTALLDGVLAKKGIPKTGSMELFFRLDVDNRPHQIWDDVYGKKAVTQWEISCVQDYKAPDGSRRPCTRVVFIPHTGRTHQLRLASADCHGFGVPIIGDTLYGKCEPGERLMLHATTLSFTHPSSGQRMKFFCEPNF